MLSTVVEIQVWYFVDRRINDQRYSP